MVWCLRHTIDITPFWWQRGTTFAIPTCFSFQLIACSEKYKFSYKDVTKFPEILDKFGNLRLYGTITHQTNQVTEMRFHLFKVIDLLPSTLPILIHFFIIFISLNYNFFIKIYMHVLDDKQTFQEMYITKYVFMQHYCKKRKI